MEIPIREPEFKCLRSLFGVALMCFCCVLNNPCTFVLLLFASPTEPVQDDSTSAMCLKLVVSERENFIVFGLIFREDVKYYFADFVCKGGGGVVPPKSVTPFSLKILSVKGGGGGTPQICNLIFGPKSGVFF